MSFWLKVENTECFDDISIYAVEVPVREHGKPEIVEAKENEIKIWRHMKLLKK